MKMMRRSGWFAALIVALFAVTACGSQGQPSCAWPARQRNPDAAILDAIRWRRASHAGLRLAHRAEFPGAGDSVRQRAESSAIAQGSLQWRGAGGADRGRARSREWRDATGGEAQFRWRHDGRAGAERGPVGKRPRPYQRRRAYPRLRASALRPQAILRPLRREEGHQRHRVRRGAHRGSSPHAPRPGYDRCGERAGRVDSALWKLYWERGRLRFAIRAARRAT